MNKWVGRAGSWPAANPSEACVRAPAARGADLESPPGLPFGVVDEVARRWAPIRRGGAESVRTLENRLPRTRVRDKGDRPFGEDRLRGLGVWRVARSASQCTRRNGWRAPRFDAHCRCKQVRHRQPLYYGVHTGGGDRGPRATFEHIGERWGDKGNRCPARPCAPHSGDRTSRRWPSFPSTTMVPSTSSITRQASWEVLSFTS